MKLIILTAILTLLSTSHALASTSPPVVIQTPLPSETHWEVAGPAASDSTISFTLFLRGENFSQLADKMSEIALSPQREWLSSDELKRYVAPSVASRDAVVQFLQGTDAETAWNKFGNTVQVRASVHTAEQLFNTTLHTYHNTETGQTRTKTTKVVLPPELSAHVTAVTGINTFSVARSARPPLPPISTTAATAGASSDTATPIISEPTGPSSVHAIPPGCVEANVSWPCLARFYGLDTYTPVPKSESVAIVSFDFWSATTIDLFTSNIATHANGYTPARLCLDVDPHDREGHHSCWDKPEAREEGAEGTMDIEILLALAYPLELRFYNAGELFGAGLVRALVDLPDSDRPGVVSISWGSPESLDSPEESFAFCDAVQQLVALGTTFIVASGDDGVSQSTYFNLTCPPFRPTFMAGCPYVFSTGATMGMELERAVTTENKSDVANGWSGAGFSNRFSTPAYQSSAVSSYFRNAGTVLEKSRGSFNESGRGYPDASSIAKPLDVWDPAPSGRHLISGGTSAAAPTWASTLGLVNSKCKEAKKGRVGWVHPVLYGNNSGQGVGVNDITVGGAYNCDKTQLGFPCTEGWDPATGLGSPRFPKLVEAFGCA